MNDRKGWYGKNGAVGEFWHGNGVEKVEFDGRFDREGFDVVYGFLGFVRAFVLYGITVGVGSVEGKA